MIRIPHRRKAITAIMLASVIAIAVLLTALLPQPWSDVASNASNGSNSALPTTSEHPEFTGPHKYELLNAWNNIHTALGRSILEDGKVSADELAQVHKAYNECLSVYGLQAKTITDSSGASIGETIVPIRGSMSGEQRTSIIDQCQTESDYRRLASLAETDQGRDNQSE